MAVKAKQLSAYLYSKLVTIQFRGYYDPCNEFMDAYLKLEQNLTKDFKFFELTKVLRGKNVCDDALAALGSKLRDQVKRTTLIHKISKPIIDLAVDNTLLVATVSDTTEMDQDHVTQFDE